MTVFFFILILIASIYFFGINTSVYLDDVFIYFTVVKNIYNGYGPVLNKGDIFFPTTSPLWTYLLALTGKVLFFFDIIVSSKILYILMLTGASIFAFLTLKKYVGYYAVFVSIPIFFNHLSPVASGGEIALVYFTLFGALYSYLILKNNISTGFFAGFGYLARGELILILIPIIFHYIYNNKSIAIKKIFINIFKIILPPLILIFSTFILINFNSFFPNTLNAKIIQGKSGEFVLYSHVLTNGIIYLVNYDKYIYILFFTTILGIISLGDFSFLIIYFTILHILLYSMLKVPAYKWYYYDVFLIITLFSTYSFNFLLKKYHKKYLIIILNLLILLFVFCNLIYSTELPKYLVNIKNYSNFFRSKPCDERFVSYSKCSDYLNKRINGGETIISNEIGIFSYLITKAVIRDMLGLTCPDITIDNIGNSDYFVEKYKPRYIIYPVGDYPDDFLFKYKNNTYTYKKKYIANPSASIYKCTVFEILK